MKIFGGVGGGGGGGGHDNVITYKVTRTLNRAHGEKGCGARGVLLGQSFVFGVWEYKRTSAIVVLCMGMLWKYLYELLYG